MASLPAVPELQTKHLDSARLFANRKDMLTAIATEFTGLRGGTVAEIGVALGDFSTFLIETLHPEHFVAFDTFDMHEIAMIWGQPREVVFGDLDHRTFYEQRMSGQGSRISVEAGSSESTVARYPDEFFDLIYVDARHTYEHVAIDAENARLKLRPGGVIVFNDYTMYDPGLCVNYGVVQAVNELVVAQNWHVVGFALQPHMFCDIAVTALPSQHPNRTRIIAE